MPNVESIGDNAFLYCTSLTAVNIPNLVSVGVAAFRFCSSLSGDINWPELVEIGAQAFQDTKITSFIAPKIKSASYGIFYNCRSLRYVDLRDIESFANNVFQTCDLLEKLIIRNSTPPSLGIGVFAGAGRVTIYVPDEAVDTYKNTTGWASHADKIKGISELPQE